MPKSQSDTYRDWYSRNRDSFNARRADKYASDPEYRERAKKAAADYRASKKYRPLPEPRNGLLTITYVASFCGVSAQTLRNWERAEQIPEPTHGGVHRLYTRKQMHLIHGYADAKRTACTEVVHLYQTTMFDQWSDTNDNSQEG